MPRFSLFRTIRTAIRATGGALPPRRTRPSCRFNLETLEDRTVPAGQIITVGTQVDYLNAMSQSNSDAANHLTTPASPDVIQFATGFTPAPLQGLVQNTGNLEIDGDVQIVADPNPMDHQAAALTNTGFLHVTGNLSLEEHSVLNNGLVSTDSAKLSVDGTLSIASELLESSSVTNWGTSSISAGEFSLGNDATINNGNTNVDAPITEAAANITAGSIVLGDDGLVNNIGASSISVSGNFTFGDDTGTYYNGLTTSATASLSVHGNFALGTFATVATYGHTHMTVDGDFSLGANSICENGILSTDVPSITVHGNFSIGDASDPSSDSDAVLNSYASTFVVDHDFTVYGELSSFVENGTANADASLMTVGGQFSMPANAQFLNYGSLSFQTKDFVLGADSSFADYGTMIVTGHFDAGASSQSDLIAGLFRAGAGSTVTTNAATWEVTSGGTLDIAGGAFSVPAGGTLTVDVGGTVSIDTGGSVTIAGLLTVDGIVDPPPIMTVQGSGLVNVDAGGQLTVDSLVVTDSAAVHVAGGGSLTATSLSLQNNGQLIQDSGSIVDVKYAQTITFAALPNKSSSDPDFAISATASSGLPVTFTASGSATVALVSGVWKVHITGAGSATITAHQEGDGNYSAADPVMQFFTISASGTTVTVPSGQLYTFTDPSGHQVSIEATGGATTTLSLQTVSGTRMQLNSMAVTGATTTTDLIVSASGGTTINNLTIAGSGIHDINLASVTVNGLSSSVPMHDLIVGSLQGSIQLTGGGHNAAIGSIGTASASAAVTLSGGFHNVVFGLVLSGSSFTLTGMAHDLAFGDVAAGATVSLGTSAQSATIHDFAGGIISGSLLVYDEFHNGAVLSISGHVYLKSIDGLFVTGSWPAGNWVGADLPLAGGGDILLGTLADKWKVIAL